MPTACAFLTENKGVVHRRGNSVAGHWGGLRFFGPPPPKASCAGPPRGRPRVGKAPPHGSPR
eukprot:5896737-Alexandrium_andersonii.AAC.1